MIGFGLAVLIAAIGIAAFPCWRHSANWGYLPSAVSGVLLLAVAISVIGDRSSSTATALDSAPPAHATPSPESDEAIQASPRRSFLPSERRVTLRLATDFTD